MMLKRIALHSWQQLRLVQKKMQIEWRRLKLLWSQILLMLNGRRMTLNDEYNFLNSLDVSTLENLLGTHPVTASLLPQSTAGMTEAEADKLRKEKKRAKARDLRIPVPKEPNRRRDCYDNPELFFYTYFGLDLFFESMTTDRRAMMQSIVDAAKYGGDQAIAGPRGEGKTTLAIFTALSLLVDNISDFPLVIGKSQSKSQVELRGLKERLQQSEAFIEDFPEIGIPFREVGAWSSRARMQTVAGKLTNIELAPDHFIFPTITREQLPDAWPDDIEPASCGQVFACLGIDGPIRGTKYRGRRPKLAIIDDVEDRQSAASDQLIEKTEEIIEQDIAGLGASAERVSRVMLCTTQNRKCIAYKYTDPKQKPSFRGKRYRKMLTPPSRMDLVEQYIQLRIERAENDPDARVAFRFWRDNQVEIEADAEISNPHSHSKKLHVDGEPLELSAIQAYYNRVADWGEQAVATEIDNDPPESAGPQGSGLSAEVVSHRISGFDRMQLPANTATLTAAIDLGKYRCHWVVVAWWKGAGGCVVDYGVAEVIGTDKTIDNEASEPQIYKTLLNWRDELLQKQYVDAAGVKRKVDCVFVDSGTFTNAAYEFVRQVGQPFHVAKGVGNYRHKSKSTDKLKAGDNMHAAYQESEGLWLFDLNTDYWKNWVHERFLTPTFDDENNLLRRGSLSLFVLPGNERHTSYAQHIVAEELVTEFKEGKGSRTYWNVRNANNHWLDATYYAAAAGRFSGVDLLSQSEVKNEPKQVNGDLPKPAKVKRPYHGQRFRSRPGGWIQGIRRSR